tara:strand:+ start:10786 stop:10953 length:168 start_codon:yes stop_codon:yes gene_type:complete
MSESLENQAMIIGPHQPFSDQVERRREIERMKEIKPVLDYLENWRYESLHARIII